MLSVTFERKDTVLWISAIATLVHAVYYVGFILRQTQTYANSVVAAVSIYKIINKHSEVSCKL